GAEETPAEGRVLARVALDLLVDRPLAGFGPEEVAERRRQGERAPDGRHEPPPPRRRERPRAARLVERLGRTEPPAGEAPGELPRGRRGRERGDRAEPERLGAVTLGLAQGDEAERGAQPRVGHEDERSLGGERDERQPPRQRQALEAGGHLAELRFHDLLVSFDSGLIVSADVEEL